MRCNKCGKEIENDARVCPNCGCLVENQSKMSNDLLVGDNKKTVEKSENNITLNIPNDNLSNGEKSGNFLINNKSRTILVISLCILVLIIIVGIAVTFSTPNSVQVEETSYKNVQTTEESVSTSLTEKETTEVTTNVTTETTQDNLPSNAITFSDFKYRTNGTPIMNLVYDRFNPTENAGEYNGNIVYRSQSGNQVDYGRFLIVKENERVIFNYGRMEFAEYIDLIEPSEIYDFFVLSALSCCAPLIFGDTYVSENDLSELKNSLNSKADSSDPYKFILYGEKNDVEYKININLRYSSVVFSCYPAEYSSRFSE